MREVVGRRVGVRWNPPALVYVYQVDQVLRLARIPLRNLEDDGLADNVWKKHENDLLQGLERRYVQRMVDILRHHHGIESQRDKHTEGTTSDRVSERGASSGSQERPDSKSGGRDPLPNVLEKSDKEVSSGSVFPINKPFETQQMKSDRLTRGSDILLLLENANKTGMDNETHAALDQDAGHNRNHLLPKLNRNKINEPNQENDKEILDLINKDLFRVQRDKRTLVNIVNTSPVTNSDKGDTNGRKEDHQKEAKMNRYKEDHQEEVKMNRSKEDHQEDVIMNSKKNEVKISVDESEDTDVDLEDLDIPLDPEDPPGDPFEVDDFWS